MYNKRGELLPDRRQELRGISSFQERTAVMKVDSVEQNQPDGPAIVAIDESESGDRGRYL